MKIFIRALFTFAFISLRKAEIMEEEYDEYDISKLEDDLSGHTGEFAEEPSATLESEEQSESDSSRIINCGNRKCYRQGTRNIGFIPEYPAQITKVSSPVLRRRVKQSFPMSEMSVRVSRSCDCGIDNAVKHNVLIRGGVLVLPTYRYPWTVALQQNGKTVCGGTLINEQYILTAAHCVAIDVSATLFPAPTGQRKFLLPSELHISFVTTSEAVVPGPNIMEIIPYPKFDFGSGNHDIAVLKLSRKIICSPLRRPICLPRSDMSVNLGQKFVIAGWGTQIGGSQVGTKNLMQAKVMRVAFQNCQSTFDSSMEENYYCLKGVGPSSPCHGDSGGPMFAKFQGKSYLFGVTSQHTSSTCNPDDGFIYTKVLKYMNWITSVIQKSYRLSRLPILPRGGTSDFSSFLFDTVNGTIFPGRNPYIKILPSRVPRKCTKRRFCKRGYIRLK